MASRGRPPARGTWRDCRRRWSPPSWSLPMAPWPTTHAGSAAHCSLSCSGCTVPAAASTESSTASTRPAAPSTSRQSIIAPRSIADAKASGRRRYRRFSGSQGCVAAGTGGVAVILRTSCSRSAGCAGTLVDLRLAGGRGHCSRVDRVTPRAWLTLCPRRRRSTARRASALWYPTDPATAEVLRSVVASRWTAWVSRSSCR